MHTSKHNFTNNTDHPIRLFFEPWTFEFDVPPKATYEIVAETQDEAALEVDYGDPVTVVYADPKAKIRLLHEGREVGHIDLPFPEWPNKMSTRGNIKFLFGDAHGKNTGS